MQSSTPDPLVNLFTEQSAKTLPDIEPLVAEKKIKGSKSSKSSKANLNTAGSVATPLPDISPELERGKAAYGLNNLLRSSPVQF